MVQSIEPEPGPGPVPVPRPGPSAIPTTTIVAIFAFTGVIGATCTVGSVKQRLFIMPFLARFTS